MRSKAKRGTKLAYVQRHGDGFRGWYMEHGRQRRGPTVSTEQGAHEWAVAMRASAERGKIGNLTLGDGMNLVRADVKLTGRRDGTLRWYEGQFRVLGRAWDLAMPLSQLDRRQVAWFVERRAQHVDRETGKRVSGSTIRMHLRALGRIFVLALREGYVGENPVLRVRKPAVEEKAPDRFSFEEVEEILGQMRGSRGARDADLVQFLFATGLRRTELAHVRVGDVNIKSRELHVRHGKRRPRVLPVPDGMVPLLEHLLSRVGQDKRGEWPGEGPERYLLPGATEQRRGAFVDRTLKRWKDKLSEGRLHPHALRHSFITYLARRGVPEHVIARLSGHKLSASSITQHYVGVHGPQVRAAMACFWDDGRGEAAIGVA